MLAPPALLLVVLGVEVQLARMAPMLDGEPLDLDGVVGGVDGPAEPLRVVWLGDSTAAGVGVTRPTDALPVVVAAGLRRPVDLTVRARSGARVAGVVDQARGLTAARPDVVVISVGSNDVVHLTSVGDFRSRYRAVLGRIPSGADVVLLGVPDMGSPPRLAQPLRAIAGWRGRRLDREVRALARAHGASYVDIAGETGPPFRRRPGRYFADDDYHPGVAGQALWADAVLAALPSRVVDG